MGEFERKFGEWVLAHRWWIIVATLVFVVLAASGGKHLYFTTNYRVFFSEDNPQLLAFEAMENTYTKSDNVLFVLAPAEGNVFTPDTLSALTTLTEQAWLIPYSNRVDSITNFQYTEAEGDDLIVGDLVEDADSLTEEQIQKIRDIALTEPLLKNNLVSEKGHVAGVNVTIQLPRINEAAEVPEVVTYARNLADQIHTAHPDIEVHITGMVMMNNAFSESSKSDMSTLVPISFVLMLAILAVLLRSITGTLVTLFVIAFSILSAMGLGGFIGFPITPPSASSPTIILTVAIANSVHVLVTFLNGMRHGQSKRDAIVESLRINLQPVSIASLTTAIGFLSMNFSEVPPFQHLGNFVAIGVVVSFILAVMFLPALLSVLPVKVRRVNEGETTAMARYAEFVVRRRTPLLWGMAAVIILLVSFIPRNELNDVFVHYFDDSITFRTDSDFTTENLTGLYRVEYSIKADGANSISDPAFMKEVDAFAAWFRSQPEVIHVNTLTDTLKRLNKNMHGDDEDWYQLPAEQELGAQYLLLYEMSLPYGLDLNNQINLDKSATRVTVTTQTLSSNEVLDLERRGREWLNNNTSAIQEADASGTTIMFANIGKRNIISMLAGTSVALVFISLLLVFALRSIKIGLVSMIPNLVPAAMGFGLWGMLVGEVGLALSVVTGMTLGIVVDDTVHFLSKYLRARRENGASPADAVRYAFTHVGRALLVTSIVLVVGFLVLAFSSFKLNSGMGLLTAMVIALALAADFMFLPSLLIKIEEKTYEKNVVTGATSVSGKF